MSFLDEVAGFVNADDPDRPVYHKLNAIRVSGGRFRDTGDLVVDETPVALVYDGEPHVVMLATPADLRDFAIGFSLTEGLVRHADEIVYLDINPCDSGIQIHIRTVAGNDPNRRQRNLTGRTGCGLCGTALIEEAVRNTPRVQSGFRVTTESIFLALSSLPAHQPVNRLTGSIHAAAWVNASGEILALREDVGRHNALDKLIGAIHTRDELDPAAGFALITSRASYEMVTKAAFAGIGVLVAISAPTALAVSISEKSNIGLVGFARDQSCVIYTHAERFKRD